MSEVVRDFDSEVEAAASIEEITMFINAPHTYLCQTPLPSEQKSGQWKLKLRYVYRVIKLVYSFNKNTDIVSLPITPKGY